MEGGSSYGNVLGFYRRAGLMMADLQQSNLRLQALLKAQNMKEVIDLAADQLGYIRTRAAEVDKELKGRFEKSYAAWKSSWDHPLIAISSAPAARAQATEFLELMALGSEILPLLMEKLESPRPSPPLSRNLTPKNRS